MAYLWLILRLAVLLLAIDMVIYGLKRETHEPYSLADEKRVVETVSGPDYTRNLSVDAYMLVEGKLYDTRSLNPDAATIDMCKT